MDRNAFEKLRDLRGKTIDGDIIMKRNPSRRPLVAATVPIQNSEGADARLHIEWNEETNCKTLNVFVPGTGPICRLEVDSRKHGEIGRSHKHSLLTPDCPSENLKRQVTDRADLTGKDLPAIFAAFCTMAYIHHNGSIKIPEGGGGSYDQ